MSEAPKTGVERAYAVTLELLRKNGPPVVGINKLQDLCKERFGVGGNTEALSEGRDLAHAAWLKEEAAKPEPKAKQAERMRPETPEGDGRERSESTDHRDGQGPSTGAQVTVMKEFIDGAVSRIVGPLTEVHQGQIAELKEAYQGQIAGLKEIHKEQLAELRQTVLWYRRGAIGWIVGGVIAVVVISGGAAYGAYWIGEMHATANSRNHLLEKPLPPAGEGAPTPALKEPSPTPVPTVVSPRTADPVAPPTPSVVQPVVADPKP